MRIARREPLLVAFIVAALAARALFWVVTNRRFEDGLTTITHARNVPLGLGLVHHLGEGRVHGFTSALGVLVPLAGELVHPGSGVVAMRVASLVAVCVALVYARLICRDFGLGAYPTAFVLAYLSFDQNMVFYGMSGMETQLAVAILLGGVHHVRRRDVVASGIWLGLAPLARPEFLLWVAPALVYLAWGRLRAALGAGGIATALVVPWVIFTTLYYGSPVPHTIIAKGTVDPVPPILAGGSILPWAQWLAGQTAGHVVLLLYHLEPFREVWNAAATPVPTPVLLAVAVLTADMVVVGIWAARRVSGFWPVAAFLGLFVAYRIYYLPPIFYHDWYLPPFLGLLMILAGLGLQRTVVLVPLAGRTLAVVLALAFALHMPFSFPVEAKVQGVEDQVRTQAGTYLRTRVPVGESVVSESAGYIGFYGNVKLYDYPGLTSPTSVAALQTLPVAKRDLVDLVAVLQPDWVVLRPWELEKLRREFPEVAGHYEIDRVFELAGAAEADLDQDGASTVSFGGFAETDVDEKFLILRRT